MTEENTPLIKALPRPEGGFMFWCPYCKKWHYHGIGEGHRIAHCHNSPYNKTGYIIKSFTKKEMKKILKGLTSIIGTTKNET